QPDCLLRFCIHAIWFIAVAIQHKKVDWSLNEFIISLLSKPEIVQIRLDAILCLVMIANGWKKSSGWRSFSVFPLILINIFMVILSDVVIYFIRSAGLIIVSA